MCGLGGGTCPPPNGNMGYNYVSELTRTVWTCVPVGPGCTSNIPYKFCTVTGYESFEDGVCTDEVCTFNTTIMGCNEN